MYFLLWFYSMCIDIQFLFDWMYHIKLFWTGAVHWKQLVTVQGISVSFPCSERLLAGINRITCTWNFFFPFPCWDLTLHPLLCAASGQFFVGSHQFRCSAPSKDGQSNISGGSGLVHLLLPVFQRKNCVHVRTRVFYFSRIYFHVRDA